MIPTTSVSVRAMPSNLELELELNAISRTSNQLLGTIGTYILYIHGTACSMRQPVHLKTSLQYTSVCATGEVRHARQTLTQPYRALALACARTVRLDRVATSLLLMIPRVPFTHSGSNRHPVVRKYWIAFSCRRILSDTTVVIHSLAIADSATRSARSTVCM